MRPNCLFMTKSFSKYTSLYCLILSIFSFFSASGQRAICVDSSNVPSYTIVNYRVDKGLPQNSIKDLALDNEGFLWFTTEKGLSRFDGSFFKNYGGPPFRIGFDRMNIIYKDEDSLLFLNRPHISVSKGKVTIDTLKNVLDNYILSEYGQYLKLDELSFNLPDSFNQNPEGLAGFLSINDSAAYFGGEYFENLHYYEGGVNMGEIQTPTKTSTIPQNYYFLKDGQMFSVFNGIMRRYEGVEIIDSLSLKSLGPDIQVIWKFGVKDVYLRSTKGNIYRLESKKSDFCLKLIIQDLKKSPVNCILEQDSRGSFWIGSKLKGLYFLKKKSFNTWQSTDDQNRSSTVSICEIGQDSILANDQRLFTPTHSYSIDPKNIPLANKLLSKAKSPFFLESHDKNGNWLGWIFRPNKRALANNEVITAPIEIGRFIEDEKEKLWAVINYKFQFWRNEKWEVVDIKDFDEGNNTARAVFFNPYTEEIWVSYDGPQPLFIYKAGEYYSLPLTGAPKGEVFEVFFSKDGMAWIRFSESGFYMYKDGKLLPMPMDLANYLQFAHCIREDDKGFFWISSDHGLFKVLKQDLLDYFDDPEHKQVYYHYYDKSWGFLNNEFNGNGWPCGINMTNGKMAFPSFEGIVVFDPNEIPESMHGKTILIDKIRINQKDTIPNYPVKLDQNFKELEFHIVHTYFGHPNNIYIDYKLEGFHKEWRILPEDGKINFSSLPHGNYNLLVKKLGGSGSDNIITASYPFKVNKMFYETFLFQMSISLCIVLLFISTFVIRNRISQRQRTNLERKIEDKTMEYKILNDELKLNMARLRASEEEQKKNNKLRTRMMAIYTHDISGPLRFIMMVAQKITEPNELVKARGIDSYIKAIQSTTAKIFKQTEHMFKLSYIEDEQFDFSLTPLNLKSLLQDIISESKEQAKEKSISLINKVDSRCEISMEKNILEISINNILQNAIKFTQSGTITFENSKVEDYIVLNVSDTGVGMTKEQLKLFKEGKNLTTSGTNDEKGTGFGLKVVKDLLKKMDAFMEIESEVGKGTTVSLFFKENHLPKPPNDLFISLK